jgi:hypothetical protein
MYKNTPYFTSKLDFVANNSDLIINSERDWKNKKKYPWCIYDNKNKLLISTLWLSFNFRQKTNDMSNLCVSYNKNLGLLPTDTVLKVNMKLGSQVDKGCVFLLRQSIGEPISA